MTAPTSTSIEALLKNVRSLATVPTVLAKLNVAVNNNSSMETVASILSSDTDLTARLLRLVNSSFYGLSGTVESLHQAVSMIGIQEVRSLALATNAMSIFPAIDENLVDLEQFWLHSIGCGGAAKVILKHTGRDDLDSIFVAGMLHDIGKLVLYLYLPEKSSKILRESNDAQLNQHEVEIKYLKYDHTMIGAALLEEWHLPEGMINAVRFHHSPDLAPAAERRACIIHLADKLAHTLEMGHSGTSYIDEILDDEWEFVGIDPAKIEVIIEEVRAEFASTLHIFRDLI